MIGLNGIVTFWVYWYGPSSYARAIWPGALHFVMTWPATGPLCLITWRGSGIGFVRATAAKVATMMDLRPIVKLVYQVSP
jgi:hypothetical protein